MSGKKHRALEPRASDAEVTAFLDQVASMPKPAAAGKTGRLVFAMDATASREPAWDRATHIQAEMFQAAGAAGSLQIQLCWYRGFMEFHASPWSHDAGALLQEMTRVRCAAGQTQIGRVLKHTIDEARTARINALVFVGDCMEEDPATQEALAGELALLGIPAFMFQDGHDPRAEPVFRAVARLTRGAYCRLDAGSAEQLKELLRAVAAYAAGGIPALERLARHGGRSVRELTHQMKR